MVLETEAIGLAAERITEEELDQLEKNNNQERKYLLRNPLKPANRRTN